MWSFPLVTLGRALSYARAHRLVDLVGAGVVRWRVDPEPEKSFHSGFQGGHVSDQCLDILALFIDAFVEAFAQFRNAIG